MQSIADRSAAKDKCFACGRPLSPFPHSVATCDGQRVYVGTSCFRLIAKSGADGYQPALGGPRLYTIAYVNMGKGR